MNGKEVFEMNTEEKRLKTFKKWPFDSDTAINKEKMAAAGFYFNGSKKEPDLVRCFICLKELDGWEEEDNPWEEHRKHAPYCQFIQLNKPESEITFQEMQELEVHRMVNVATKVLTNKIEEFKKQASKTRQALEDLV